MKVALCFIISYEHILNKEEIWKEWIEPNKDIINVYFYYKDFKKIKSEWIMKHTIPPDFIYQTSYYHVIPAYLSIMNFAIKHDIDNQWFCMLTDSCCPIISPKKFRYLFFNYYNRTILNWKKPWWNINFHKRANLALLPEELRLANDPWFVIKRENVLQCLNYANVQQKTTQIICSGGLANESLFAVIMYAYSQLDGIKDAVICAVTHTADWSRPTSITSPHLFKEGNETDVQFINKSLKTDKYVMFIRKVSPEFPDTLLQEYIYKKSKETDDKLMVIMPFSFIILKIKKYIYFSLYYGLPLLFLFKFILYLSNVFKYIYQLSI
jgi:hypothetical protein